MKALYLNPIYASRNEYPREPPGVVTVEYAEEGADLHVSVDGKNLLTLALTEGDCETLRDLIPSSYEFKTRREQSEGSKT